MSRRSMRAIAQQWLTQPPIPDLNEVFRGWGNQMQLVASGATVPVATLGCIHIAGDSERRITMPAVLGWRLVDYQMQLQVCHVLDGDGDDVADSLDDLIEAIKARLRNDPRMGQPALAVFESGQGRDPQIQVRVGDTQYLNTGLANGTPVTWFVVQWTATEQINA